MNAQIITTPNGERMVMLPEADYRLLLAAAENASDMAAVSTLAAIAGALRLEIADLV